MRKLEVCTGQGVHVVEAIAVICGRDLNICFGGGDTFHIGACALAVPRPSLKDNTEISASASVICATSHKEDEIARSAALRLAAKFNARVSVSCGLHIDNATPHNIEILYKNYLLALEMLEQELRNVY